MSPFCLHCAPNSISAKHIGDHHRGAPSIAGVGSLIPLYSSIKSMVQEFVIIDAPYDACQCEPMCISCPLLDACIIVTHRTTAPTSKSNHQNFHSTRHLLWVAKIVGPVHTMKTVGPVHTMVEKRLQVGQEFLPKI